MRPQRSIFMACNPNAACEPEASKFEVGFFEDAGGAIEEAVAEHAVHHTMVIGERQVHHDANRKRVGAIDLDDDRTLLDLAHPQDSDLRLIDDREAVEIALAAGIGKREAAAAEIIGGDFFLLHLAAE